MIYLKPNKEEVEPPKGRLKGVTGPDHPRWLPLSKIEEGKIRQFDDWLDKNPQTISNRLRNQRVVIGVTRIKRLQEQERALNASISKGE